MRKVMILGLDSAAPPLVYERWKAQLPNLSRLMHDGAYGRLRTTHPPITIPAWTSMMSSLDPGQLGLYGFRNRKDHSYDGYRFATSSLVRHPRLWDLLGSQGKRCIVLGVPQTYPPHPLNGEMVACFLTPNNSVEYTYPAGLKDEVERVTCGYTFDVENFRTSDKKGLLDRCYTKTRKHLALVKHMLRTREWDFFMAVEMGIDRIQHGFWSYMDPEHHRYIPGNPFEHAIRDYYRYIDAEVGEILELLPGETTVLVVSDHGARRMHGGLCFNEWLVRNGFLTLARRPSKPSLLSTDRIDWARTRAWGDGGYYGRCFLNVQGREPNGTVASADYEKVRDDLVAAIAEIEDPMGKCLGAKAYRPEELYRETTGVAPDLIVYFGDLRWRSVGSVGMESLFTFENDTGPDEANHDWLGLLVMGGSLPPELRQRGDFGEVSIYDIAPTVMHLLGLNVPEHMIGRPIC